MKCLECQYDLSAITSNKCPECGRAFDRGDSDSYFGKKHVSKRLRQDKTANVAMLGSVIASAAHTSLVYAALLIARLKLGRWPNRYGMDDPKDISWTTYGLQVFWMYTWWVLLASIALGVVWTAFAFHRWWRVTDSTPAAPCLIKPWILGCSVVWWIAFAVHLVLNASIFGWILD